jgi:hypothetical protein
VKLHVGAAPGSAQTSAFRQRIRVAKRQLAGSSAAVSILTLRADEAASSVPAIWSSNKYTTARC